MRRTPGVRGRGRAGERGQGIAELGITIVLLVTLAMGIIEFGRAFMIANMITHAARDGGRAAAVIPASLRNASGIISDTTAIQTQVRTDIQTVVNASGLTVDVTQPTVGGIPLVQVNVTGSIPYVFKLWGTSFSVNRSVTFRDEGR